MGQPEQAAQLSRNHAEIHVMLWLPSFAASYPLTQLLSLCSRKEHFRNDKPCFSGEDGLDHPSDCSLSLDLRVPHPSYCRASVLEVSTGLPCLVGAK